MSSFASPDFFFLTIFCCEVCVKAKNRKRPAILLPTPEVTPYTRQNFGSGKGREVVKDGVAPDSCTADLVARVACPQR